MSSKISALTSGNPAQSGDLIPIARSGANFSLTAASIAALGGTQGSSSPAYFGNWENVPAAINTGTSGNFNTSSGANIVQIMMFRLPFSFSFNTLRFQTSNVSASLVGIGIYSSAGSRLVHWDSLSTPFNNNPVNGTPAGGASILTAGYYYWAYACSITSTVQSAGGLTNSGSGESAKPWNVSVVRMGYAANAMSAGVLPPTLGSLTAGFPTTTTNPLWIVEP